MAQIFHPSTNYLARALLVGGGALTTLLVAGGITFSRSPFNTRVGVVKEQPVPFSHEHHTVELGIDCRYCHTSVEKSAYAGLPATQTCMSCHSQIWTNSPLLEPVRASYAKGEPLRWNQVHTVPDFVYFNHSIHVNRGVNCNNCHGPIQKEMMAYKGKAFFMAWCLNCHRNPEKFVGKSRKEVFELYRKVQTMQYGEEDLKRMKEEGNPLLEVAERNKLTPEQRALSEGEDYNRTDAETEVGLANVKAHKLRKEQLTDCSTCHH